MRLDDSTEIKSATLIDLNKGKELKLFERTGCRCHFHKEFTFKNYFIQLRLDWSDIRNNEPTLDADIWIMKDYEKKFLKKGEWHHTERKIDPEMGRNIYKFRFKDLELRLVSRKTVAKTFSADAILIRDSVEVEKKK